MDWSQERYVRLYTRDTPDWVCWTWQARALLPLLLRKVDRTGALSLGRLGVTGLSALVGLPEEVTSTGLDALLEDGSVVIDEQTLLIRNFIEAQETPISDIARQRDHRERKRAKILKTHDDAVTKRHAVSRGVTPGHAVSQSVTPNLAEPSLAEPNRALKETLSTCVDPAAPAAALEGVAGLVALWNETAHPKLPRVEKTTEERRKAATAALKQVPLERWPKIIAQLGGWSFALGENDRGWVASFDWLLAKDRHRQWNYLGLLEGAKGRKPQATVAQVRKGNQYAEDQGWDQVPFVEAK